MDLFFFRTNFSNTPWLVILEPAKTGLRGFAPGNCRLIGVASWIKAVFTCSLPPSMLIALSDERTKQGMSMHVNFAKDDGSSFSLTDPSFIISNSLIFGDSNQQSRATLRLSMWSRGLDVNPNYPNSRFCISFSTSVL